MHALLAAAVPLALVVLALPLPAARQPADQAALDARVRQFLDEHEGSWHDLNVPASDGQLLHDLIVEHRYTRALEIGTSTGHSGIWIAWALSKTGGKLITVELDEARHREALANFEAAGLARYIDARLGNAHTIVPSLEGPFDFVFSDADKDWYNISARGRRGATNSTEYLAFLRTVPNTETTVDERGAGMTVTFKRAS